jgi:hypothetical protein
MNYCSWDCHVHEFLSGDDVQIICPNALPIRCLTVTGKAMEHEHADHKDYKFPVDIENTLRPLEPYESGHECHAVIDVTNDLITTIYETRKHVWDRLTGTNVAGHYGHQKSFWRVSVESMTMINKRLALG